MSAGEAFFLLFLFFFLSLSHFTTLPPSLHPTPRTQKLTDRSYDEKGENRGEEVTNADRLPVEIKVEMALLAAGENGVRVARVKDISRERYLYARRKIRTQTGLDYLPTRPSSWIHSASPQRSKASRCRP